jgi:NADH-quinone oxidoreductase subunit K
MPEALQALNNGVPISWYLILSALLFALGVAGFLFRRNILVSGQIFTFFVMVVAAAEAAVGLAIILTVFKNRETLNIDEINSLKN